MPWSSSDLSILFDSDLCETAVYRAGGTGTQRSVLVQYERTYAVVDALGNAVDTNASVMHLPTSSLLALPSPGDTFALGGTTYVVREVHADALGRGIVTVVLRKS